ncbi:MAG: CBS domain-containing protein [Myxococcales bacterium]|nr:CBS domain-containing protein [Myxococcales bacterium]
MSTDLITLNEEDNLRDLVDGMGRLQLRHLPVVDDDRLVGLITHRDVLRLTASALDPQGLTSDARILEETFVHSVMRRDVQTVGPEARVIDAARTMTRLKLGCLPVVDEAGRLVGIVTEHDLLRFLVEELSIQDGGDS